VKSTYKFDLANFTVDGDSIGSIFLRNLIESPNTVYVTVPQSCQYRSDLLSKDFFGDSRLYWVFQVMNSIMSVEEFSVGNRLKAVTLDELERLYTQWKHSNAKN
jgi:hypothetical protein